MIRLIKKKNLRDKYTKEDYIIGGAYKGFLNANLVLKEIEDKNLIGEFAYYLLFNVYKKFQDKFLYDKAEKYGIPYTIEENNGKHKEHEYYKLGEDYEGCLLPRILFNDLIKIPKLAEEIIKDLFYTIPIMYRSEKIYNFAKEKGLNYKIDKNLEDKRLIKDDWSKGIAFIAKISTKSLKEAFKKRKVVIGNTHTFSEEDFDNFIELTSLKFNIRGQTNLYWRANSFLNVKEHQSELYLTLYDNEFTYKEFGGKENFKKAKLTTELQNLKNEALEDLENAGLIVNQCKILVGGSENFDYFWRQAQIYNDSKNKRFRKLDSTETISTYAIFIPKFQEFKKFLKKYDFELKLTGKKTNNYIEVEIKGDSLNRNWDNLNEAVRYYFTTNIMYDERE